MTRIFARWQNGVIVSEQDAHHVVHVLRMRAGETLELVMEDGIYQGLIHQTKPLIIHRIQVVTSQHELTMHITLIYPVSKGDRMDWVVQKATELGVSELIACDSDHAIVHWQKDDLPKKFNRYQKMIAEATLQSKREKVMKFTQYLPLAKALTLPFDHKWIASEHHQHLPKPNFQPQPGTIAIVVGPEGGFSQKEMLVATGQGYQPISLGPSILRTETAVIAALAMLRYW